MKGIIFTEFLDLMTSELGLVPVEKTLAQCDFESGCAYSSVGNYNPLELVQLLQRFSKDMACSMEELIIKFAKALFRKFEEGFPQFFGENTLYGFLENVESYIHPEVRKLYPDAELPSFTTQRLPEGLEMVYHSKRALGGFAHGLILAAIERFQPTATAEMKQSSSDGTEVVFLITDNVAHG